MTWIDVVSDAVKIGLGALIGSAATLVKARIDHQNKINEEYSKRRRDNLESIMPIFEIQSHDAMHYTVKVPDAFDDTQHDNTINKTIFDTSKYKSEISEINYELVRLEAKVLLLGFDDLAAELRKFWKSIFEILELTESTRKKAEEKVKNLDKLKTEITKKFANAYKDA